MHGDFSRWTFDARKGIRRVLQRQGSILLDADWNELNAVLLDHLQTLARDVVGTHGGPAANAGFQIAVQPADLLFADDQDTVAALPNEAKKAPLLYIGSGHYWVNGLAVTLDKATTFLRQPFLPPFDDNDARKPPSDLATVGTFLIYIEVWEREFSEGDDPLMRETALLGPGTCFRSRLVWQIRAEPLDAIPLDTDAFLASWWNAHNPTSSPVRALAGTPFPTITTFPTSPAPRLRAGVVAPMESADPCVLPASARYRGLENQLYRIEIHQGSAVTATGIVNDNITFKWSRDNGSIIFPLLSLAGTAAHLQDTGRDERSSLRAGSIVEVLDDTRILHGDPGALAIVTSIDIDDASVTLEFVAGSPSPDYEEDSTLHPFLRKWDYAGNLKKNGGALSLKDASSSGQFAVESGIWIQFESVGGISPFYRTGDYWTIPARTATGSVEWPQASDGAPIFMPPSGIGRHFAPLAFLSNGVITDARKIFP